MLRPLALAAALLFPFAAFAVDLQLPTENHHLFTGEPEKFYMYVDRIFEGETTKPWEGGSFGFVRTPLRVGKDVVLTKFHEGIDIQPAKRDKAGNPLDLVMSITGGMTSSMAASGLSVVAAGKASSVRCQVCEPMPRPSSCSHCSRAAPCSNSTRATNMAAKPSITRHHLPTPASVLPHIAVEALRLAVAHRFERNGTWINDSKALRENAGPLDQVIAALRSRYPEHFQ